MLQNVFQIKADLKKKSTFVATPEIVQNDNVRFEIEVTDNGKPLALDNVQTVSLAHSTKGETVVTSGEIEGNKVIFNLGTLETKYTGQVNAVVQLYDAEGRISTIKFPYYVVADPTGKDYVPSEKEQTLIEVVMSEAQAKIDELSQVDVVDLKAKQDEFTVQLAQTDYKTWEQNLSSAMSKVLNKLERGEKATIVFLGDSTTEANVTNNNNSHPEQMEAYLKSKYGTDKVTVINSGVSGNTIRQMLNRAYSGVVKYRPDLVFISSGFNDVGNNLTQEDFEYYYKCLIEEILATNGEDTGIVLRTQNLQTTPDSETMQAFEQWINPSVEKLARAFSVGFADFYSYEKDLYYKGEIDLESIMYDYTHPNESGQTLIFEFVKKLFEIKINSFGASKNFKYTYLGVDSPFIDNTYRSLVPNSGDGFPNGRYYSAFGISDRQQTVKFYGTNIGIQFGRGTDHGILEITIDGELHPDLDTYAPSGKDTNHAIHWIDGLEYQEHTLVIKNKATANPLSNNNGMVICGYIIRNNNNTESLKSELYHYNLVGRKHFCEVTKTSTQSLTTTVSKLLLDKVNIDENAMFDASNNRIVIKKEGIYAINLNLTAGTLENGTVQAEIRINGSSIYFEVKDTASVRATSFSAVVNKKLNVNDYIEVWVKQSTSNPLEVLKNGFSPILSVTEL